MRCVARHASIDPRLRREREHPVKARVARLAIGQRCARVRPARTTVDSNLPLEAHYDSRAIAV